MNGIKESIKILVQTLYIEDDSSFILLDDLLKKKTGVFYYFLGATSSKRYLKKLIVDSMKSLFGNQVVEDGTKGKRRGFYVDSKYSLEGSSYITPSNSDSFSDPEKLKLYISGSKVVFERRYLRFSYYHVGILLVGKNNHPNAVIELSFQEDSRIANLHVSLCVDVMNNGTNADNPISIQGNYLDQKGISIPKILYRYARIAHKAVQYHESDLNCDVLATYLQLGQPIWVTMTKASYRAAKLAELSQLGAFLRNMFIKDGEISLKTLEEVEQRNNILRSDQMQQMLSQPDDESTVRKSKRISKDKGSKEG